MRSTSELAEYLGLSRWTVSRVLNGHPGCSERTRRRVLEAVEELEFQPSALARGLRGGRTGLVGICFQEMDSPIRARKAAVLQTHLREVGMRGMMELNAHDPELERTIIRHFLDLRVDAIILFGSYLKSGDALLAELVAGDTPVVVVDPPHKLPLPSIALDRREAMEQGLRHLHGLGHRCFALLGLSHDAVYGPVRRAGLKQTAKKLGLDWDTDFRAFDDTANPSLDYAAGAELVGRMLDEGFPATAIIALNDCLAIGALRALRDRGKRVPADYSVLGFDDIGVAAWMDPALTSLSQETEILSRAAMDMLAEVLEGPSANGADPPNRKISSSLVVRASTGPASRLS